MLFWIIAAVLTLGASLAVLMPLTGRLRTLPKGTAHDLEVYRDQLSEVEGDAARGLIGPSEATQARTEIARRILKLDAQDVASPASAGLALSGSARVLATVAVLAVPLLSWGIYVRLGSPDVPSQPLAERLAKNPSDNSIDELVARAESHLATDPSDGRGWDVLAPVYLRMGRFADAVTAYRNAIRLEGSTAARQAGLGEAMTNVAGGIVSSEAQQAFEAARKLQPDSGKAGFFLALALAQEGRTAEAADAWAVLREGQPADSPWREAAERALERLGQGAMSSATGPGPTQEDVDAARNMSSGDRAAMIETMVAGLDDRLKLNPRDAEGWTRLIRSYLVLGRTDQAHDALQRGIAAFGADSTEAKNLSEFAASLGMSMAEQQ